MLFRSFESFVLNLLVVAQVVEFVFSYFLILVFVCGAADPSQGPWEPGALRAALSLGGQATAGGALHLPFPSL